MTLCCRDIVASFTRSRLTFLERLIVLALEDCEFSVS